MAKAGTNPPVRCWFRGLVARISGRQIEHWIVEVLTFCNGLTQTIGLSQVRLKIRHILAVPVGQALILGLIVLEQAGHYLVKVKLIGIRYPEDRILR